VNQRRFKVGVLFGDPETMPGGETMKFISSLTVRLYGKNVIDKDTHPELPCWKHTEGQIKKSKVPITSSSFVYDMAMIPANDLDVGDTASWTTVSGHLKGGGLLEKVGQNWELMGEKFPNLVAIQERYLCDLGYRVKLQQEVVKLVANQTFIVGEQEAAPT
jgi:recombination protein RecA